MKSAAQVAASASSVALGDMRMYGMIMHPHQQILCFRAFHLLQLRCKDGFLMLSCIYIYANSSMYTCS